jgi:phospholipid/cholesterol/gamma-HCH transport system substrate-binding protein
MASYREIKVGAFVLAGLMVVGLVIFLIGDERKLFTSKHEYRAVFQDVQGLKQGSPVRMGGVDVGSVSNVEYSPNPKEAKIHVVVSIVSGQAERIRGDSVATIENKGLLGDKMVVISVGSQDAPPVAPGGTLQSHESEEISAMLSKLGSIGDRVDRVVSNLETTTGAFADEKLHGDIKAGVGALSNILQSLDKGNGYAARLLHDEAEADRLSRTMAHIERASADLEGSTREVRAILARVRQGPGLAHEVIYGEDGARALAQFGGAAEELTLTLRGVREGTGLARSVLFGDGQSEELTRNLNAMSGDLRQIVADLRSGKGTLGALLVDPSVYEDLKLLLGNVDRNKTLRALVRYSIKSDEAAPNVEVRDPAPARSAAGAAAPAGQGSE